jgi:hypothetical protein
VLRRSGGGWQDSGGVWPGVKLIEGVIASEGDPEFSVSRGRLLPDHRILGLETVTGETRQSLQDSLVLVHGGMAQNVGPILEMVTEKYLWAEASGRAPGGAILEQIVEDLQAGDIRAIGAATMRNFAGPLQTIIPWASNLYTELLIERAREAFGPDFWGFWMLGGMSGGGMGFIFDPAVKPLAQDRMQEIMCEVKARIDKALPFAMDPVVYDFAINEQGTWARLLNDDRSDALPLMPPGYYARLCRPSSSATGNLPELRSAEMSQFGLACRTEPEFSSMVPVLFDRLLPHSGASLDQNTGLERTLTEFGFDHLQHEQIRADLRAGRIGLAQNRLPVSSDIRDVGPEDVHDTTFDSLSANTLAGLRKTGLEALAEGVVAVVTLAGGVGSRWTQGAGVVKALHPFCKLGGRHRAFIEVHLAKSRRIGRLAGATVPHVITTSYLTHEAIEQYLAWAEECGYGQPLLLPDAREFPMARDLRLRAMQQLLMSRRRRCDSSRRLMVAPHGRGTTLIMCRCNACICRHGRSAQHVQNGVLRACLNA